MAFRALAKAAPAAHRGTPRRAFPTEETGQLKKVKYMAHPQVIATACHSEGLAEILERVLDKGVVIAGDIKIKLCDIELLSIQIRLLIASVDKAREMGLSWWWQSPQQPLPPQAVPGPAAGLPAADVGRIANPSSNEAGLVDGLAIRPTGKPAPVPSPLLRRAQPVENVFAQLSQPPKKQKGPCDGQSPQGTVSSPAARRLHPQ